MIFLDTSGLLCLFDASDVRHHLARMHFDVAVNKGCPDFDGKCI